MINRAKQRGPIVSPARPRPVPPSRGVPRARARLLAPTAEYAEPPPAEHALGLGNSLHGGGGAACGRAAEDLEARAPPRRRAGAAPSAPVSASAPDSRPCAPARTAPAGPTAESVRAAGGPRRGGRPTGGERVAASRAQTSPGHVETAQVAPGTDRQVRADDGLRCAGIESLPTRAVIRTHRGARMSKLP